MLHSGIQGKQDSNVLVPAITIGFFSLIILFYSTSGELNTQIEGIIVPGLYLEEIPDLNTIYYDKLVPVILEFKIFPGLTSTNTIAGRSRILPRLACRTDDKPPSISTSDWFFTCPLSYHISNLLNQLYANWTDIQTNNRGSTTTRNNFNNNNNNNNNEYNTFYNSELNFDECESQLRYWRGINNRDIGLAELKIIIEKCSITSYFEEQILDYSSSVGPIYEQMRDNYVINFFSNISSSSSTTSNNNNNNNNGGGGDMIGTLVALQSFMTLNFYTEVTRWKDALSSCQNNLIPNSIVKLNRLEKILQDIKNKLNPFKYIPSITSITKLYKIPIVDCIFGQNSFFVRILVPIKKDKTVYRPIRINQPRFLYNDELCQVTSNSKSDGAFPLLSTITKGGYLIEKILHTLILAGCSDSISGRNHRNNGQMCKIPDKTVIPPPDKCLTSIINENLVGIKTYCKLDCEKIFLNNIGGGGGGGPIPLIELPIIHRIESNKFIITLNKITSILIKCESTGLLDQMIPPQKYGAIEITLPCECYIMFHSDKYFPYEPCTSITISGVIIHHTIPIHMINSSYESYISSRLQPWSSSSSGSSSSGKSRNYFGRRKITFANVSTYINMTFHNDDIIEVDVFESDEDNTMELQHTHTQTTPQVTSTMISNGTYSGGSTGTGTMETNSHITTSSTSTTCNNENNPGGGHGSLWTMIIIQFIFIIIIFIYFIFKIHGIDKRIEQCSRTSISFTNSHNQSQLTLSEKY